MSKKRLIYKFNPLNEFTYKNLLLSQIWFSPLDKMNDQLEGLIKIKNTDFNPTEKAIDNFSKRNWRAKIDIKEFGFLDFYMNYLFRSEISKYCISCFSKKPTESLMWAHYANKHTGICLIYDSESILENLKALDQAYELISIKYGLMPTITLFEKNGNIDYSSDMPIISTKDSNWKYEKEVRFYLKDTKSEPFTGRSVFIPKSSLKGIIYGYHTSHSDRESLRMILDGDYEHVMEYNEEIDYKTGKIYIE